MATRPPLRERASQLRAAYTATHEHDPKLPLFLIGTFLGTFAVILAIGFVVGLAILLGILGFFVAILATMLIFYRRATSAGMRQIEGQEGAAYAVLQSMRGDWQVTPAVAVNGNHDMVHRAVGRAGVVLVGEGSPGRVRGLIVQERRRVSRVAAETPVHEVIVGDDEGLVPLRKLQNHVTRLPRALSATQTSAVKQRMRSLGAAQAPVPKGPMPRGARVPRGGKMR